MPPPIRPQRSERGNADRRERGRWQFSTFYGLGAAAGFSPREVGDMSLWHFLAAVEGFGKANWGLKDAIKPMTIERLRELGIE